MNHLHPAGACDEEAHRQPLEEFVYEKAGSGVFHNSSAESEAPGTEINSPIPLQSK